MEESFLNKLPLELQLYILDFLRFEDLLSYSLVCRYFTHLTNESIAKKGCFRIKHTFPDINILNNLVRNYRCVFLQNKFFIYEPVKIRNILSILEKKVKVDHVKLKVYVWNDDEGVRTNIEEFFHFMTNNQQIKRISLSSSNFSKISELIGGIRSILQHVSIDIFEAQWQDHNREFLDPEKLQALHAIPSDFTENDLLSALERYKNLKTLAIDLSSPIDHEQLSRKISMFDVKDVPLRRFTLRGRTTSNSEPLFQSLSVFRNLEYFRIVGVDLYSTSNEIFQKLYTNNKKTLKRLVLEGTFSNNSIKLLPSDDLTLEDITLFCGCDKNTKSLVQFLKMIVKQQRKSLKTLHIELVEALNIHEEIMHLLLKARSTSEMFLRRCKINVVSVTLPFSNLKVLDLRYSKMTYSSLYSFLGSHQIQETLESLSLQGVELTSEEESSEIKCSYNFQKLKNLNLYSSKLDLDFLDSFNAPELEELFYNFHHEELTLHYVLKYPKLKWLRLGNHSNFEAILEVLSSSKNLTFFEIEVSVSLLTKLIECLLTQSENIKLAKIQCSLDDTMKSLETSFEELNKNHNPKFKLEYDWGNMYAKFSNMTTTIFIHGQGLARERFFYEYFFQNPWPWDRV